MLAFCWLSLTVLAQEPVPEKGFLTLHAGLSAPRGDFGSKAASNPKAGLANKGFHVALEYGHYFNKHVGLGATFGIRRNSVDLSDVNRYVVGTNLYAETKWRTGYLLANALVKMPLSPAFALYLKGSGGFSFNTMPEITNSSRQPEQKISGDALAYGLGGGFKVKVSNTVNLGLEVFSLYTEPEFEINSTKVKQEMNAVNYSFSIGYLLK